MTGTMEIKSAYRKLPKYQKKLVSTNRISLDRLRVLFSTVNQGWDSFKNMKLSEFGTHLEKNGVTKPESFTIITIYGKLKKVMYQNGNEKND